MSIKHTAHKPKQKRLKRKMTGKSKKVISLGNCVNLYIACCAGLSAYALRAKLTYTDLHITAQAKNSTFTSTQKSVSASAINNRQCMDFLPAFIA
jgi:hypothetical protein